MDIINKVKKNHSPYVTYLVWAIAWGSVFGSLYFSEVLGYIPCELCWWQRLLIYPLAIFATVAIARKEFRGFAYYALPFGLIGIVVSLYHSLLQWGVIEHNLLDCSEGAAVSCSNPEIMLLGFITIPFLAFVSFVTISAASAADIYMSRNHKD